MKKLISMLLVLAMLLVCFAACTTNDDNEEETTEKNPQEIFLDEDDEDEDEEEDQDEKETEKPDPSAEDEAKYNQALALIESGDYASAYALFKELGDYKDSATHLGCFYYVATASTYEEEGDSREVTISYNEDNLPSVIVEKCDNGE